MPGVLLSVSLNSKPQLVLLFCYEFNHRIHLQSFKSFRTENKWRRSSCGSAEHMQENRVNNTFESMHTTGKWTWLKQKRVLKHTHRSANAQYEGNMQPINKYRSSVSFYCFRLCAGYLKKKLSLEKKNPTEVKRKPNKSKQSSQTHIEELKSVTN